MRRVRRLELLFVLVVSLLIPVGASAQTVNGAIIGVVKDTSGAIVPDVAVTLRNVARDEMVGTTVTDAEGNYAFRNLPPATYEVQATKDGFSPVRCPTSRSRSASSCVSMSTSRRAGVAETVEVTGGSSVLGTTATQEHGIAPETLNQLPLLFGTGPRAAATFALLMPGVSTGGRQQRVRRAGQRRPAIGRRGVGRWRQHAAGLHEPGRHGVDSPGLPDVARHGQPRSRC